MNNLAPAPSFSTEKPANHASAPTEKGRPFVVNLEASANDGEVDVWKKGDPKSGPVVDSTDLEC